MVDNNNYSISDFKLVNKIISDHVMTQTHEMNSKQK